jgi:nucleoside-triphosphatase
LGHGRNEEALMATPIHSKGKELQGDKLLVRAARAIWDRIDVYVALAIAAGFTLWGTFFEVTLETVAKGILATLTVVAFALVRDRVNKSEITAGLQVMSREMSALTSRQDSSGEIFRRGSSEQDILKIATEDVLLVQETGSQIFERDRLAIVSLLKRGGRVRVVLAMPDAEISQLMALRNANLAAADIALRARTFPGHLRSALEESGPDAERLEIRHLRYPMYVTGAIVDGASGESHLRQALVRFAGFDINFSEKLVLRLSGQGSPNVFTHYREEFEKMYLAAAKFILVVGAPHCGKSTLFAKLSEQFKSSADLYSVYSEAVLVKGRRTGFRAIGSEFSDPVQFASRNQKGEYDLEGDFWTDMASRLDVAVKSKKVVVLDEVGPLQLRSEQFKDFCRGVLEKSTATVIASGSLDEPFVATLRRSPRCTVYHLTGRNQAQIEEQLTSELRAALRTAEKSHERNRFV